MAKQELESRQNADKAPTPLSEIKYIAGDSWTIKATREEDDSGFLYLGAEKGEGGWRVFGRSGTGSGSGGEKKKFYGEEMQGEEAARYLSDLCKRVERTAPESHSKAATPWFCSDASPYVGDVIRRMDKGESFEPTGTSGVRSPPPDTRKAAREILSGSRMSPEEKREMEGAQTVRPPYLRPSMPLPASSRKPELTLSGLFSFAAGRVSSVAEKAAALLPFKMPAASVPLRRLAMFFSRSAAPSAPPALPAPAPVEKQPDMEEPPVESIPPTRLSPGVAQRPPPRS